MNHTYPLLFALFCLLGTIPPLSAQGWERFYTNHLTTPEAGVSIVATPDGHYVVAGHSNIAADTPFFKYFLIKLDIEGNELWAKFYTDIPKGKVSDVVLATGGGFVLSINTSEDWQRYLVRVDESGNHEWTKNYTPTGKYSAIEDIINTADGGYAFTGWESDSVTYADASLWKMDAQGEVEWSTAYDYGPVPPVYFPNESGRALVESDQGDFFITGHNTWANGDSLLCLKYNSAGDFIWRTTLQMNNGSVSQTGSEIFAKLDGTIDVFTRGSFMIKLNSEGDTIWTKNIELGIWSSPLSVIELGSSYAMTGLIRYSLTDLDQGVLIAKMDSLGNPIWYRSQNPGINEDRGNAIIQTADAGFMVTGYTWDGDAYVFKSDSLGIVYNNHLSGQVVWDELGDCLPDAADLPLEDWLVQAVSADRTFTTSTDETGHYFMPVDTGDYTLSFTPLSFYLNPCEKDISVSFSDFNIADTIDIAVGDTLQCPYMQVDVSNFFFRPCMPTFITVQYCNFGTAVAEDAYLEMTLDSNLIVDSTSIPIASQNGPFYTFELGDVEPLDCHFLRIYATVECDLDLTGQSLCNEAHIYPDSLCGPTGNYAGALIVAHAACQDSIVKLEMENIGDGTMTVPLEYIVIEDAVLLMQAQNGVLISGETFTHTTPANGVTYTIISIQEPTAPYGSHPIASVEGCGTNGNGTVSTGFTNQFPQPDDEPWLDIDCRTVTNGYDPNDKQSFPQGYGNQHFIEPNGEIEYLIRFQNTGTDTAFNIVVRDTLSPLLDLSGLRVGASSHAMDYKIYGENILEFSFPNILLPDSTTNELGSNGFVEFKIPQQKDLPAGTVIYNSAAIFFDFNPPVITNETWLTIEEDFIIVLPIKEPVKAGVEVTAYPNPFYQNAVFEIKGIEIGEGVFEIYNAQGQLLRSLSFNGNRFEFEREGLAGGVYFYKILDGEKGAIAAGAVVVR